MNNIVAYQDLIAFHPGTYVADIIEEMNITQAEFAERLGTTPKTVSKIVNAEDSLSKDLANKLSKVTGISLATWLNLQNQYDIKFAQINDLRDSAEEWI